MCPQAAQRGHPQKCGSDDSGQDASWKPDDDEMACEMDDDEDITSDEKSVADDEEGLQCDEPGNQTPSANQSDGKPGSTRRKAPIQSSQEWKESRKSMKGLRELAALIDGVGHSKFKAYHCGVDFALVAF